jgi:hypothetical protein
MQKKKHPVSIYSVGGIYGLKKEPDEVDNKPYNVYGNVMAYGNGMTMQETPIPKQLYLNIQMQV